METIANAWSPCTFRYSTLQTAADLRKTIYSKFPDVNFEAHKFYELQDGRCSVIKHEDGLLLHMKAEQLASNPANQLYFSAAPVCNSALLVLCEIANARLTYHVFRSRKSKSAPSSCLPSR